MSSSRFHGRGVRPDPESLADRAAITEVLFRYGRGMDRMDRELTLNCWHPGGTDDHAPLYRGTAEGFIDWVFPVHAAMLCTRHEVTNVVITIEGDRAGSEAYWQVIHRILVGDQVVDVQARGRYVDVFERIDGVWAIRHRQSIRDWSRADEVTSRATGSQLQPLVVPNNPEAPEVLPRRDRDDYSYFVLEHLAAPPSLDERRASGGAGADAGPARGPAA